MAVREHSDRALGLGVPTFILTVLAVGHHGFFFSPFDVALADKDFANYWIASRLVLSDRTDILFGDHAVYFDHLRGVFGPEAPWRNWSYPPHYLLFVWPLGLADYAAGMALFLAVTGAFYLAAARSFLGRLDARAMWYLMPFAIFNTLTAQNGFLTAALLLGALAWRYERPVFAGILAGCLTVKPQLGLLLPLLFLVERRWTTIAAAVATTLVLLALSAASFGIESWQGYLRNTLSYQGMVMNHGSGIFLDMMPSVFGTLRNLGAESGFALAVHAALAVPLLAASVLGFLRCDDHRLRAAILVAATMVVTPYSLAYDLGGVAAVAVLMALPSNGGPADGEGRLASCVVPAAALLPLLIVPLGMLALPAGPVVMTALLAFLLHRAGLFGHVPDGLTKASGRPS